MKSTLVAASLFVATIGGVSLYPYYQSNGAVPIANEPPAQIQIPNQHPVVDVVFVLDTTGSMGGLIDAAKEKIWSIATTMAQAEPAPRIRIGLVGFRDRGDDYVTKVIDLSTDLDSMYAKLMDFQADGGGDGPESVNQALHDAVHRMSWSQDPNAYKAVFLVGDAPPHMDYQDDMKYPVVIAEARSRDIVVNAIQCGTDGTTAASWREIATLADGNYFQVEQHGSAVAIATPFDEKLAELSSKLDDTRIYYGTEAEQALKQLKVEATEKLKAGASVASRARRAAFNISKSGAGNLFGDKELVEDVASGRVALDSIANEDLPAALRSLAPEKQHTLIQQQTARRGELKRQITSIAEQRAVYLKDEVAAEGGGATSLDAKLFGTVRAQAEKKGLHYETGPAY